MSERRARVNMRGSPDPLSIYQERNGVWEAVGTVPDRSLVTIHDGIPVERDGRRWLEVSHNGVRGWVDMRNLQPQFTPAPSVSDPGSILPPDPGTDVQRARELINEWRQIHGLGPLEIDSRLISSALAHARDLSRWDRISHFGSDGSNPWDRVVRQHSPQRMDWVGENVGTGQQSLEQIVRGWIDSPGHNVNLLFPEATRMGLALVRNDQTDMRTFWVLNLSRLPGDQSPEAPPGFSATGAHLTPAQLAERQQFLERLDAAITAQRRRGHLHSPTQLTDTAYLHPGEESAGTSRFAHALHTPSAFS